MTKDAALEGVMTSSIKFRADPCSAAQAFGTATTALRSQTWANNEAALAMQQLSMPLKWLAVS